MIEEYNLNKNRHVCNGLGENSSEYENRSEERRVGKEC